MSENTACVIVNADDFGASHGINRGIVEAHLENTVTSASLMVNMPAADAAVALAGDLPDLSVGLHVNFTNEGDPVVPLDDVAACRAELHRQIDEFCQRLQRPPTHLDSHHNVHLRSDLPGMGELFIAAAGELTIPLRGHSGIRYVPEFYGQWDGETHPEQVSVESFLAIVAAAAGHGVAEVACHPGYRDPQFASIYHHERELELTTLLHPATRSGLSSLGIRLVGFAAVRPLVHPR